MNVKLGICNFCCPGTGVFAPQMVAEVGLDGMSVEYGSYENGYALSQKSVRDYYLDAQQKYGIEYANVGCSNGDFVPLFAKEGDELYDVVDKATLDSVDAAAYMKIPMVFFSTFLASFPDTDEKLEGLAKRFQKLCDYANDKNIVISWENPLPFDKQKAVIDAVDRPNFNLFYDSNNYYFFAGMDQVEILDQMYDYMGNNLHVKDGTEGCLANAVLGTGANNFYGTAEYLKKRDYNGWIILENLYELKNMRHLNPEYIEIMKQDVAVLKKTFR